MLKRPRLDDTGMINESRIGLGHFRFVEHGYIPVDSLDELVKFTDNQIDVVTKATLSLTVSCARCHDHKFDPISQEDYYALFGFFASSRPTTHPLVTRSIFDQHRQTLNAWRSKLKKALKTEWLQEVKTGKFSERLKALGKEEKKPFKETDLLYPWFEFDKSKDFQQRLENGISKTAFQMTSISPKGNSNQFLQVNSDSVWIRMMKSSVFCQQALFHTPQLPWKKEVWRQVALLFLMAHWLYVGQVRGQPWLGSFLIITPYQRHCYINNLTWALMVAVAGIVKRQITGKVKTLIFSL